MNERAEMFTFSQESEYSSQPRTMEPGMVKLKLKQTDLVRYSPLEKALFEIIRSHRGTPLNTAKLAEKFYDGEIPLNGRTIISVTINALIKKTRWNKEEFKVCRSPRSGPNSTTVWIEHNA